MRSQPNMPRPDGSISARSSSILRGRQLFIAWLVWIALAILSVVVFVASATEAYVQLSTPCQGAECDYPQGWLSPERARELGELGLSLDFYAAYNVLLGTIETLGYWAIAAILFWKRSDDLLVLLASIAFVMTGAGDLEFGGFLWYAYPGWRLPVALVALAGQVSFFVLLCLFPNGRFVPRWMRWLAVAFVPTALYTLLATLSMSRGDMALSPFDAEDPLFWTSGLVYVVLWGSVVVAQIYRYRRVSGAVARQQTKWVVFGLAILLAEALIVPPIVSYTTSPLVYELYLSLTGFVGLLIPLSFAIAILRYRLWDIDLIINRTLLYGTLSACIVGIYVLVVGGLGTLFDTPGNPAVSLLAAGLVAVLFAPLRTRLQHGVNRLMYGERDDPYSVLSHLGRRLQASVVPQAVLTTIVETVAQALKVPYAAIALGREGDEFATAAEYGSPDSNGKVSVWPLVYRRETFGRLLLAPRAPNEPFSSADERLIEDLVRQAEVAVHAVLLTDELQRSRERLVTAREEERRRLRRDLHDGVGPQLAALMLELETASELVSGDPEASALMAKLSERTRETVADVRRSVHALRPPALDELGLLGALREGAAQYGRRGLNVSVEATPNGLSSLPAAVEVACYRIAQEAMTNAMRHAQAHACWVRIALDEEAGMLYVEVEDDGRGIGDNDRAGVGMSSMRERAEELGGSCTVGLSAAGGTLVSAVLPCRTAKGTDRKEE